ncbi:MAG: DUF4079 domain-containing protein [Cyanobacteria bacterium P01_H01_bin.15]
MDVALPESVKVWSQFGHPIMMWVLFALSVYALYSGVQIFRIRSGDKEVRKKLVKKKFKDRHHQIGSILISFMVLGTIGGMAVTYINNGKLFVDAHLIVGLGMTGLIAMSVSMVPFMQKGQSWARYTHWAVNLGMLGLFGWEAVSGMEILQRIVEKM